MDGFRFGTFEFDVSARQLRRAGFRLRVPDQSLEILSMLLARAGDLVSREEIRARLWPSGTFVDFDHGMNAAVNRLREALADSAATPRYIETIPRRGYRFIGAVERLPDAEAIQNPPGPAPGLPDDSGTSQRKGKRWRRVLPAAVAVVAAAVSIIVYLLRPERYDLTKLKIRPFATEIEIETLGVWSPDGKSATYLKMIDGRLQLMVRGVDAAAPTQLTKVPDGVSDSRPFFSPDSERIYFITQTDPSRGGEGTVLRSIARLGGEPREVLKAPWISAAALSPDGKALVLWYSYGEDGKRYSSLWISSPPGATPRKYLPAPFRVNAEYIPNFVRFSPDGTKVAISGFRAPGDARVWILPWPDGPKRLPRQVFPWRTVPIFDWMPDSRHVVLSRMRNLWLGDTRTGNLQQLTRTGAEGAHSPSVSPDGERVLFTLDLVDYHVIELPLDGSAATSVLPTLHSEFSPSWSAAGDKMAFVTDRSGEIEIWLRNPGSGGERAVVRQSDFPDDPGHGIRNVALSPDGTRLGYVRHARLWVSPVSGGGPSPAVLGGGEVVSAPSWSPTSSSMAYITVDSGHDHLAVTRIGSQEPQFIVPNTANQCFSAPAWSPDGRWIACIGVKQTVLLVSPDGKQRRSLATIRPSEITPRPLVPLGAPPIVLAWSPDSATLYMASPLTPTVLRLDALDIRTGKLRKVADYEQNMRFETPSYWSLFGSLGPGGKSIATTVVSRKSDLCILEGIPRPRRRWF